MQTKVERHERHIVRRRWGCRREIVDHVEVPGVTGALIEKAQAVMYIHEFRSGRDGTSLVFKEERESVHRHDSVVGLVRARFAEQLVKNRAYRRLIYIHNCTENPQGRRIAPCHR